MAPWSSGATPYAKSAEGPQTSPHAPSFSSAELRSYDPRWSRWLHRCSIPWYGYGSIPINTIFRGMNIHLPAILMFTRGTRFWHTAIFPAKAVSRAKDRGSTKCICRHSDRWPRGDLGNPGWDRSMCSFANGPVPCQSHASTLSFWPCFKDFHWSSQLVGDWLRLKPEAQTW